MADSLSGEKKRLYLYDNLKFLLILFVVLGHLIDGSCVKLFGEPVPADEIELPHSEFFSGMFVFLYAFHMPLFIFISGLFNRRGSDGKKVLGKVLGFCALGMLMKCLLYWSQVRFQTDFDKQHSDDEIHFDLLGGDSVCWYLFAMAAFVGICYLFRNSRTAAVLIVSVMIALAAGYDPTVGDEYSLSRIAVFFPFYYCGYVFDPEKVAGIVKKWYVKIISAVMIVTWVYFCFWKTKLVYPLRMLLTGRNSYWAVTEATGNDCTFWSRLLVMGISAALCFAFLGIGFNIKIPVITKCGSRTLQVYFWHRTIIYMLTYYGYQQYLANTFPDHWALYLTLTAVPITMILCIRIFGVPLDWVLKAFRGDNKVKEKANNGE